jgi:hypothetical protein
MDASADYLEFQANLAAEAAEYEIPTAHFVPSPLSGLGTGFYLVGKEVANLDLKN